MKKLLKIIGYSLLILIMSLLLLFVVITVISFVNKKPVMVFGIGYAIVETDSMYPTIIPGDYILVQETDFDDLNVGDILAFWTQDYSYVVVHEIAREAQGGYVTRGINSHDSTYVDDEDIYGIITPERVVGKVIAHGGHVFGSLILDSRGSLLAIIVLAILVIFVLQIVDVIKHARARQKEKLNQELEAYKEVLLKEIENNQQNQEKN
jgi:signal peptidase I